MYFKVTHLLHKHSDWWRHLLYDRQTVDTYELMRTTYCYSCKPFSFLLLTIETKYIMKIQVNHFPF